MSTAAAKRIDLNLADNWYGVLNGEIRVRLVAAIQRPCEETWNDVYGIILRSGEGFGLGFTLWKAVLAVDPTFPRTRAAGGWERTPDAETLIQAINYATR